MDKYPRLTQDQVDIWLDSSVTKAVLDAYQWKQEQLREAFGNGAFVDSANSDITFGQIHSALGEMEGLEKASDPVALLHQYEMIEEKDGEAIQEGSD